jgi:AmmeMemoRadiSam system protein A
MSPLNEAEQRWLLILARQALTAAVADQPLDLRPLAAQLPTNELRRPGAAFVSLHRHGRLRGCVGYIVPVKPLYETVVEAAIAAALYDRRFAPVTPAEVPELEVEISVLSPFFAVAPGEVRPGEHGLMVTLGSDRGLLLPQVAREYGWTRERFLEETCAKAGLEHDAWKHGARIEAFTALVFSEAALAAHHSPSQEK